MLFPMSACVIKKMLENLFKTFSLVVSLLNIEAPNSNGQNASYTHPHKIDKNLQIVWKQIPQADTVYSSCLIPKYTRLVKSII